MSERLLDNENRYRLLRLLADNTRLSQRELARELDVSLGKLNYCLRALLDVGYVKAKNFKNSDSKQAYLYKLTPEGVAEKATARFRAGKETEYETLKTEFVALRAEVGNETKKPRQCAAPKHGQSKEPKQPEKPGGKLRR